MRGFLVVLLAGLLTLPATVGIAAAQTGPGGSEFDQYVPEVPEAEDDVPLKDKQGKKQDGSDSGGSGGGGAAVVPPGSSSPTLGSQDQAVEDDEATTSRRDGNGNGSRGNATGDGERVEVGGTSSAGAVADTLGGESDDGIGIGLPLLLVATVVAGIGYVLVRRRATTRKRSAGPGAG